MTFILDLDLDIMKTYPPTEFVGRSVRKLELEQHRQTHRRTRLKILARHACTFSGDRAASVCLTVRVTHGSAILTTKSCQHL